MAAEFVPTHVADGAELVEAYSEFWREFVKLADRKVTPSALTISPIQLKPGLTLGLDFGRGTGPIALLGITSKGAPRTSALDIYLAGTQVVSRIRDAGDIRWVILRSEFDLLYLNALENAVMRRAWREKARPSVAYAGYKFVSNLLEPMAVHYPDCHAKYNLDAIEEEAIERVYKEDHAGWDARARHGQPQIPSAPLDLVGLLYMVLHCHLGISVEKGWPKKIGRVIERLPAFKLDINSRSRYASWYDHSHAVPPDLAPIIPTNAPIDFKVPPPLKAAGWNARIRGRERTEVPHLTINFGDSGYWRSDIQDGRVASEAKRADRGGPSCRN